MPFALAEKSLSRSGSTKSPSSSMLANKSSSLSSPKSKSRSTSSSSANTSSVSASSWVSFSSDSEPVVLKRSSSSDRSSSSSSLPSISAASPILTGLSLTSFDSVATSDGVSADFLRPISHMINKAINSPGMSASAPTAHPLESSLSREVGAIRSASARLRRSSASSFSTSVRTLFSSPSSLFRSLTSA